MRNFSESQEPEWFLRQPGQPRAVCRGMANLFFLMAEHAGLAVNRVSGGGRSYISSAGRLGTHAWNVVTIAEKDYLVDCSADARLSYSSGEVSPLREYNDFWLLAAPELQRLRYRPYDAELPYEKSRLSKETYMSMPLVNPEFVRWGLSFREAPPVENRAYHRKAGTITELYDLASAHDNPVLLRMRSPGNVALYPRVTTLDGKTLPFAAYTQWSLGQDGFFDVDVIIQPPAPGIYRVNIRCRYLDEFSSSSAYTFYVKSSVSPPSGDPGLLLQPPPGKIYPEMMNFHRQFEFSSVQKEMERWSFTVSWQGLSGRSQYPRRGRNP